MPVDPFHVRRLGAEVMHPDVCAEIVARPGTHFWGQRRDNSQKAGAGAAPAGLTAYDSLRRRPVGLPTQIEQYVATRGVNLVGFASVAKLNKAVPVGSRPEELFPEAKTFVVLVKRTLLGIGWSRHKVNKQLSAARSIRALDRVAGSLSEWLETAGNASLPVSSNALDFDRRGPSDVTPCGQGSYLQRCAAVEAGLATWGLNKMILTPEFGPRLFLGGLLTTADIESRRSPLPELCPGLETCGRCAAACPEDAIPRKARKGIRLEDYRALDAQACARSSQPFGYQAFQDHLVQILETKQPEQMWSAVHRPNTGIFWTEMSMVKEGVAAGCSECAEVCPVGADYERLSQSPHRKPTLPDPLPREDTEDAWAVPCLGRRETRLEEGS